MNPQLSATVSGSIRNQPRQTTHGNIRNYPQPQQEESATAYDDNSYSSANNRNSEQQLRKESGQP